MVEGKVMVLSGEVGKDQLERSIYINHSLGLDGQVDFVKYKG